MDESPEMVDPIDPSEMRRPKKENGHLVYLTSWQQSFSSDSKMLFERSELMDSLEFQQTKDENNESENEKDDFDEDEESENDSIKKSLKLTVREDINSKVFVWLGNIANLTVDAIVNPTNERMTSKSGISGPIMDGAGHEIYEELLSTETCKIGECRITKGYRLPSQWILHTVGPRFNAKYSTAAENALHNCYRSCMDAAIENKLRSIAIPPLHSIRRGYPMDKGAHIALRTIRRFLEKWVNNFEKIILVFDNEEEKRLYESLLCLYFPRNTEEEDLSEKLLPEDNGNQFGEIEIKERKIRIQAFPFDGSEESTQDTPLEVPSNLTVLKEDRDIERIHRIQREISEDEILINQTYLTYLALSHNTNLSHIEKSGVFYQTGHDSRGRPVMVLIGSRLPEDKDLLDHFLLYYIKLMDSIANNPYVLIYVHTNMSKKSKPEIAWIRKVHDIMDCKYGDHLQSLYVLHPTFWLKALKPIFSLFMGKSNKIFSKVVYTNSLHELVDLISIGNISVPEDVIQHDIEMNGTVMVQNAKYDTSL